MASAATLPPTSLPSRLSPTNTELPLWTYKQLEELSTSNLKTRALNLKQAIAKADWVPKEFETSLRTNGEHIVTIRWILEVQSALLRGKFTPYDFGLPIGEVDDNMQYFDGELPSIKRTHKTIMATSPKKGPKMHETGGTPERF